MDDNSVTPGGFGSNSGGTTGTTSNNTNAFGSGSDVASNFNVSSASDKAVETCATCGQSIGSRGLEQFLGRLGITDDMMNNLKGQFQNVDIDEYLNTARDYLKDGSTKATSYAKENPGKVAAGVAALAVGAGLLFAAVNRDRD